MKLTVNQIDENTGLPCTYEACLQAVKPDWNIDFDGRVDNGYWYGVQENNVKQLPTEATAKRVLAITRLFVIAAAVNKDWEADWEDEDQSKWIIGYNTGVGKFRPTHYSSFWNCFLPAFKTQETAQHIIDNILSKEGWAKDLYE